MAFPKLPTSQVAPMLLTTSMWQGTSGRNMKNVIVKQWSGTEGNKPFVCRTLPPLPITHYTWYLYKFPFLENVPPNFCPPFPSRFPWTGAHDQSPVWSPQVPTSHPCKLNESVDSCVYSSLLIGVYWPQTINFLLPFNLLKQHSRDKWSLTRAFVLHYVRAITLCIW